ncbi:hypothetical protein Tco_0841573 [Tanacetum coccineum]|uniref:Uncharacterized protein n=1 Tax=Tanacetum coccineum TaxID=301880 RepID=A0ABQ5B129_9ASTR
MVVQNQPQPSTITQTPTTSTQTSTTIQPTTSIQPSQPQKQQLRKTRRKVTEVPQPSKPIHVPNEAVYEEMDDSLVRAATTATSLDAEHDRGGGPRCQETMGDTSAQTRFERVSKQSNDPLLAGVNTPQSGEDSLKLQELMALCTTLQQRVLDLEKTKTSQQIRIESLEIKVKKLQRSKKSRSHKLKRLYKGRIANIDAAKDIYLANVHRDEDMFGVNDLDGDEVVVETKVASKDVNLSVDEVTLAQTLQKMKSTTSKAKRVVIQERGQDQMRFDEETVIKLQAEFDEEERIAREKDEANIVLTEEWDDIQAKIDADYQLAQIFQAEEQEELSDAEKARLFVQLLGTRRKHFAAKRAEEKRNKPPTQAQQRRIMCTYLKNMEGWKAEMVEENLKKAELKVMEGSSKRAGEALEQESTKKQKVDEDKSTTELQSLMEVIPDEEEVAIDDIPLATKVFSKMLKSFSREDLEDLYKLVRAKYMSTRPVEDLDLVLWNDLKNMFEPHVEDAVSKFAYLYAGREKVSPTPPTIIYMLNKKLQVDYFSEMAYQLLKLLTKQLKK